MTTNPGVLSAQAHADVVGVVHDLTIAGCTDGNATCTPNDCDPDTGGGQQTVSIQVRHPCISVTKQCDGAPFAYGEPIKIKGTITNCGDETLVNIGLVDSVIGNVTLSSTTLAPGASQDYSFTYSPTGTGTELCGPFSDTVTVSGTGQLTGVTVTGEPASATCPVLTSPCIDVTKTCDATVVIGQPINFQVTVSNCSANTPLTGVTVVDSIAGTIIGPVDLAPGASQTFNGTHPANTIPNNGCGPLTDTVTATGTDPCTDQTVTDTATCTTTITTNPCIDVTKTCDATVAFGQPINFQVTVSNCSANTPLTGVTVVDSIAGTIIGPISLAPGASQTFNGTHAANTIPNNGCGPLTDTVTATGNDGCTGQPISDTATCTTTITTAPALTLTKVCDPTTITTANGSYTETFTVVNTGNVPLSNVVVHDNNSKLGNADLTCSALLAPGASCTVTRTVETTTADCPSITDTATATGTDVCTQQTVTSNPGTCTVNVPCPPDICITKAVTCAPQNGVCDDSLTYGPTASGVAGTTNPNFCYKIVVTNCGQDDLENVTINDPDLPGLTVPGTLAVGESVTLFASKTWGVGTHVNTVTTTAVGVHSGTPVDAEASATVTVVPISVSCEIVQSSTTFTPGGAPVQVTLKINNPSEVDLDLAITGLPTDLTDCEGNPFTPPTTVPANTTPMTVTFCVPVACPGGTTFTLTIVGTAIPDSEHPCVYDSEGNLIKTAESAPCPVTITCPQAGCTPGFWKNCVGQWPIPLTTTLASVFNLSPISACGFNNLTLLQALSLKGGSTICGASQTLLRAAAAAYLNSLKLTYPLTPQQVKDQVNAALATGERSAILSLASQLDANNNLGCKDADGNGLPCRR